MAWRAHCHQRYPKQPFPTERARPFSACTVLKTLSGAAGAGGAVQCCRATGEIVEHDGGALPPAHFRQQRALTKPARVRQMHAVSTSSSCMACRRERSSAVLAVQP